MNLHYGTLDMALQRTCSESVIAKVSLRVKASNFTTDQFHSNNCVRGALYLKHHPFWPGHHAAP